MKIIAELCQNHNGDFDTLHHMIKSAAKSGADIIKIQSIKADRLKKNDEYEGYRPFEPEYARLKGLELSFEDEINFIKICNQYAVEPMTTVFDPADADYFNELGYDFLKLSGYSIPKFEYGLSLSKFRFKKLFFSTSSLTLEEIERTVTNLRAKSIDFTMLHCICAYPTPLEKLNLQNIQFYKTHLGLTSIGLSDHSDPHSDNLLSTKLAIFAGIDAIERHFTVLDKDETRDGKVSVTPEMLSELKRFASLPKEMQYKDLNQFDDTQKFNHDFYRKRF